MRFNHLALPARDQGRSRRFYEELVGFAAGPAQRYPDGVLIVRNAAGFDLALGPGEDPLPAPVGPACAAVTRRAGSFAIRGALR